MNSKSNISFIAGIVDISLGFHFVYLLIMNAYELKFLFESIILSCLFQSMDLTDERLSLFVIDLSIENRV
jgi:hypothetical protein